MRKQPSIIPEINLLCWHISLGRRGKGGQSEATVTLLLFEWGEGEREKEREREREREREKREKREKRERDREQVKWGNLEKVRPCASGLYETANISSG